jgi:hypothetical protein
MHAVDLLRLHFDPSQMFVLNLAMAFLMFSVALDVRFADFRKVAQFPRSVGVGLLAQYLVFPLLTLGIIFWFEPPVSVAMGMVLVSMCPSGNMTNFLVHFARANVALSVTLNAIIILSATVITPTGFLFWSKFVPGSDAIRQSFEIKFADMALIIMELIVLPLLLGMWLHERRPDFAHFLCHSRAGFARQPRQPDQLSRLCFCPRGGAQRRCARQRLLAWQPLSAARVGPPHARIRVGRAQYSLGVAPDFQVFWRHRRHGAHCRLVGHLGFGDGLGFGGFLATPTRLNGLYAKKRAQVARATKKATSHFAKWLF